MLPSTGLAGLDEADDMVIIELHGVVDRIELSLGSRFWCIYTTFWEGEGEGLGSRFHNPYISQNALSIQAVFCL